MITTSLRSLRSSALHQVIACEAGSSRIAWQVIATSSKHSTQKAGSIRAFTVSAARRQDDFKQNPATNAAFEPEAVQDAASHAPSAFSMPTLLPSEALPESFRATQSDSPSPAPPFANRNVYGTRREPHRLHVLATRNNTIMTLTTSAGDVLSRSSSGALGFRNAARSSYDAAYRVALHVFERIEKDRVAWQLARLEIIWNGFGQGREAVYRAILSAEGNQVRNLVTKMSDNTPIKVGGTRPKKRRML